MKKILIINIIIWIIFIFQNSLAPGSESTMNSSVIVNFVNGILEVFNIYISKVNLSIFIRKSAHAFEFFVLFLLSLKMFSDYSIKRLITFSCLLVVITALIDEGIQLFVEGRSASLIDVAIDSTGIIIGLTVSKVYGALRKERKLIIK